MKKKLDLENRVNTTLGSLDDVQRATPGPFFFTRVQARLERDEKSSWERISSFIGRPQIAFAGLCIVVVLNLWAVLRQDNPSTSARIDLTEQSSTEDYSVAANSFIYEENSDQP